MGSAICGAEQEGNLSKNRGHRIISFQTAGYEVADQRTFTCSIQPYTAPGSEANPAVTSEQPGTSR